LHFEVRVNNLAVDPYLYFGGSQSSVGGVKLARLVREQDAPVDFVVRLPDGSGADGVTVIVLDEESREELARCETLGGRCSITLPPGVYPVEFAGRLPDGREVAPVGAGNVEFMQRGQAEYLYGPLAFYHTRAASTVGVVLLDEDSQAGPYFDADPGAVTPVPLIPAEVAQKYTPPPGSVPPPVTPMLPIAARPSPADRCGRTTSRSSSWTQGLLYTAVLAICVLLVLGGVWLRRWRERRKRRGDHIVIANVIAGEGEEPAPQAEGGAR
jgi:hypothetical protein